MTWREAVEKSTRKVAYRFAEYRHSIYFIYENGDCYQYFPGGPLVLLGGPRSVLRNMELLVIRKEDWEPGELNEAGDYSFLPTYEQWLKEQK